MNFAALIYEVANCDLKFLVSSAVPSPCRARFSRRVLTPQSLARSESTSRGGLESAELQSIVSDWTPLNFTGQYHDFESNLDYFGARYYSSTTGRFTSPDPTGGIGDDPQTLNKYSYVVNNPLRYTDPYGLWHCDWGNGDVDDTEGNGGASQQECRVQGGAWWVSDPGDTDALFIRICMSNCLDSGAPSAASGAGTASSPALGNDEMGPFAAALPMAADIATPGVNFASAGLMIFGIVVAPSAAIGPPACAALDCGSSGWAMATLPLLPEFSSLAPSTRNALLAVAKNQKLRNIIKALYKTTGTVGDGGTADAIRAEIQTGLPTKGKFHTIAGINLRRGLQLLLRDPSLDQADRAIVKRLLIDLQSALSSRTR